MKTAQQNGTITLADLAAAKGLSVQYLAGEIGLHDLPGGGVGIPYHDEDGLKIAVKRRLALKAKDGSRWPANQALAAYGDWRLHEAHRQGRLVLVEGESDCWALWRHDFPALGLPGSNTAKTLAARHLANVPILYVHREPDTAGTKFVEGVTERLRSLRYTGRVYVFDLSMCGVEDPSALHVQQVENPGRFEELLEKALDGGIEVEPKAPAEPKDEEEPFTPTPWPDPPADAAYRGLAGKIVRRIDLETEADPAAVLAQFLVAFGNVLGRSVYQTVGIKKHFGNLNLAIVGRTSKSRKGTSWSWIESLLAGVDPEWFDSRVQTGLSSGEGLISAVRDDTQKREPVRNKETNKVESYQNVITDHGTEDKRLLVVEEELASVLRMVQRDGNILSAVLRQLWDGGRLRTMTRNHPLKATDAHGSVIGHITREELLKSLEQTEVANGFCNRFLWVAARRSKLLPEGGEPVDLTDFVAALKECISMAHASRRILRTADAREYWHSIYADLTQERGGVLGLVTTRAEAQVLRLSSLYAVLDCVAEIRTEHLESALAFWDYCVRSCTWIFGQSTGDADTDELLDALRKAGEKGMSRTDIRDFFSKHKAAKDIVRLLGRLHEAGLVTFRMEATAGRSVERWWSKNCDRRGKSDRSCGATT